MSDEETTQQGGSSVFRIILLLTILTMGAMFIPIFLLSNTIDEQAVQMQTDLDNALATLAVTPNVPAVEATLRAEVMTANQQGNELSAAATAISQEHMNWPAAMGTLLGYDTTNMSIKELTQDGSTLTLWGDANDETYVLAYAELLRTYPEFADVLIGSIDAVDEPDNVAKVNTTEPGRAFEFSITITVDTGAES